MKLPGRIIGRIEGDRYVIRQGERVLGAMPLGEARKNTKLAAATERNGWEKLP
jgi:hypothetical protein